MVFRYPFAGRGWTSEQSAGVHKPLVGMEKFELSCTSALVSKTSVSSNSTTSPLIAPASQTIVPGDAALGGQVFLGPGQLRFLPHGSRQG